MISLNEKRETLKLVLIVECIVLQHDRVVKVQLSRKRARDQRAIFSLVVGGILHWKIQKT